MFDCVKCEETVLRYSKVCPKCNNPGTLVPRMKQLQIAKQVDESCTNFDSRKVYTTGFPELDAVFPPGLLSSCLYLFVARSGTGKTTLLFQTADVLLRQGARILYVMGEMSMNGILGMREHYKLAGPMPEITFDCDIRKVASKVRGGGYDIVIIDSLQTMSSGDSGRPSYNEQAAISIRLKNLAHEENIVILIVTQVNKDGKAQGTNATVHNVDVAIEMVRGHNSEVLISTPEKNRQSFEAADRAVLVRTRTGLVSKPEIETGHLLRHTEKFCIGLTAAPVFHIFDFTTDEFNAVGNPDCAGDIVIHGAKSSDVAFLKGVLVNCFPTINLGIAVRASLLDRYDRGADLAVLMAILSRAYNVPIPVNVAFIGSVDSDGTLLLVPEIEKRVRRAKDQGHLQIFGPKAVGSMTASWIECRTIHDVVTNLELVLTEQKV